jgi:hypothetical protein
MTRRAWRRAARTIACAMALAASVSAASETADPRAVVPLLRARDFSGLEHELDRLGSSGARTREGWLAQSRSLFALGIAAAQDPDVDAALADWLRASPDEWTAAMASGWRHAMDAKPLRTVNGPPDFVEVWRQTDSAARAAAGAAFARARSLAPHSREPGAALLGLAIADGVPVADRMEQFAQVCAEDRVCETARVVMLTGLEPYLGGSVGSLVAFARSGAREAPEDPNLAVLVAIAHRKAVLNVGDAEAYFRQTGVYEEVEAAYARYLAAYPDAIRHRNEYAQAACWAGRRDTARKLFDEIGDAYYPVVWKNDFDEFRKRRDWALGTGRGGPLAPPGRAAAAP